jgi:eukaryotic-like serine/threonine-protein kinase
MAVLLGVTSWALWRATQPVERPLVRLDVDLDPDVSLGSSRGADTILSPDGSRLVYVSQRSLFTRRLDQPNASDLAGTEGAYAPFFSPDGQWVAFFAQGKLKKISVEGGAAIDLCDAGTGVGGQLGRGWQHDRGAFQLWRRFVAYSGRWWRAPLSLTQMAQGETTHR